MAKKSNAAIPVFQLKAVELHDLNLTRPAPGTPAVANYSYLIHVESNADKDRKLLIASTNVKIRADQQGPELGSITCACIFSVSNFDEVISIDAEGKVELHQEFANTINSIAISTTRGVMFSELKGTFLHYAFLPVVDIKAVKDSAR